MKKKTRYENEVDLYLKEVAKSGDKMDYDYSKLCCDSAVKAYKSLLKDGHSGCSIAITKSILNNLIDGTPLTPITGEDDEWDPAPGTKTKNNSKITMYQNLRKLSLFKEVNNDTNKTTYSDVDRVVCYYYNMHGGWGSGYWTRIVDQLFPITFPYDGTDKFRVLLTMHPCKMGLEVQSGKILRYSKEKRNYVSTRRTVWAKEQNQVMSIITRTEAKRLIDKYQAEKNPLDIDV